LLDKRYGFRVPSPTTRVCDGGGRSFPSSYRNTHDRTPSHRARTDPIDPIVAFCKQSVPEAEGAAVAAQEDPPYNP